MGGGGGRVEVVGGGGGQGERGGWSAGQTGRGVGVGVYSTMRYVGEDLISFVDICHSLNAAPDREITIFDARVL